MVLSLGKKMGIGFGIVILLIIINSTVSIKSLKSVIHSFEGKVMVEKDIQLKSEKLRIELLQIRRREKDFMSRKDIQYSDLVNKYLNNTRSTIAEMENTSSNTVIMPKLRNLKNEIDKYAVDFGKLVQVVVARGLTENDGVQGEFRTAAHRFETAVKANPIRNGQRLYLTARKHEKDYMLRGAKKYIDRTKKVIEQLRKNVLLAQINQKSKKSFMDLLDIYERGFSALVHKDEEINIHLASMKKSADKALSLAEDVDILQEKMANKLVEEIKALDSSSVSTLWVVSILSILVGLAAAFFLTRMITVPLSKVKDVAWRIAEGDLSEDLNIEQND